MKDWICDYAVQPYGNLVLHYEKEKIGSVDQANANKWICFSQAHCRQESLCHCDGDIAHCPAAIVSIGLLKYKF